MKNLVILALFCFLGLSAIAQQEIHFSHMDQINGPHIINAHPNSSVPGVIIVSTRGFQGNNRYINIIFMDHNQNVIWSNDYFQNASDPDARALSIKKSDRSYILTGYARNKRGIKNLLVFKINLNGVLLFSQIYEDFQDPNDWHIIGMDIVPDHSGNSYIGVGFRSRDMHIESEKEIIYFSVNQASGSINWIHTLTHAHTTKAGDDIPNMATNITAITGTDNFYVTGGVSVNHQGVHKKGVLSMMIDELGALVWFRPFKNGNDFHDFGASSFYDPENERIYNLSNTLSNSAAHPVITILDLSGNRLRERQIVSFMPNQEKTVGFQIIHDVDNEAIILLKRVDRMDFGTWNENYPVRVVKVHYRTLSYLSDVTLEIPSEQVQDVVGEFLNYHLYPGSFHYHAYTPNIAALNPSPNNPDLYIVTESNLITGAGGGNYHLAFVTLNGSLNGACEQEPHFSQSEDVDHDGFVNNYRILEYQVASIDNLSQEAIPTAWLDCDNLYAQARSQKANELKVGHLGNAGDYNLSAYPNPSNGNIHISFTSPERVDAVIGIYDIRGRLVWADSRIDIIEYLESVDLTSLPKGIYMLKLTTPEKTSRLKLMVQ